MLNNNSLYKTQDAKIIEPYVVRDYYQIKNKNK